MDDLDEKMTKDDMTKLFAVGAHQLKSPMNSVYTLLDVILYTYKDRLPEDVQKLLDSALKKTEDLKNLINDLLQFGKIEEKTQEEGFTDVDSLITQINMKLTELAKQKKVNYIVNISRTLPLVKLNAGLLYNIIYNLIENAVSYTPSGGKVELKMEYNENNKILQFVVSDTGIGIPSDNISNIFKEFYRAPNAKQEKSSGTGLGLAIVKKSIDILKGEVEVESVIGKGTAFTVKLPYKEIRDKKSKKNKLKKRVIIIGGGAGGPKTAAKLRRLTSDLEIILIEKEEFLSYSGCGLPYYISGDVKDKRELMSSAFGELRNPDFFKRIGNIIVYNYTEAIDIDRKKRIVKLKSINKSEIKELSYDYLVIATGGNPRIPEIEGINLKNIFTLHNVRDADKLKEVLAPQKSKNGVIVGGGLIGMELAESLLLRGVRVSVIEKEHYVLPMFDEDVSILIQNTIELRGIKFYSNEYVKKFNGNNCVSEVVTNNRILPVDLVIVSTGINPNVELAQKSRLKLGKTGAIEVNQFLQTSDPSIYAVGDCIENTDIVTGDKVFMPLGSTANKHGRVAALNIAKRKAKFRGIVKTVVFKIFNISVGKVGMSTKEAIQAGYSPLSVFVPSLDREHYYPDAQKIIIKMIGDKKTEKLLGVQIFGIGDVVRRIDVAAVALMNGMKIDKIRELDLAYLPAFGLPFDPIIIAANVWENYKLGIYKKISAASLNKKIINKEDILIIDVRTPEEYESYSLPGAINIPLGAIRAHVFSLDPKKEIILVCATGSRSYSAYIILKKHGFKNIKILDGGTICWPYV